MNIKIHIKHLLGWLRCLKSGVTYRGGVSIGDDTWIGINVVIAGTVEIGKHCVIGANSVVTHDIPDYSVAAGCPARVIKQIK